MSDLASLIGLAEIEEKLERLEKKYEAMDQAVCEYLNKANNYLDTVKVELFSQKILSDAIESAYMGHIELLNSKVKVLYEIVGPKPRTDGGPAPKKRGRPKKKKKYAHSLPCRVEKRAINKK